MYTIIVFGAMCGPPISGVIQKASGGWEIVGIYAGKRRGHQTKNKCLLDAGMQERLL